MKTKTALGLLAFAGGLIQGFSFAPAMAVMQLIALAILFFVIWRSESVKSSFFAGFLFGFGWFAVSVSWVYVSIHEYGYQPAPIAAAAVLIFAAFLALFPALSAALTSAVFQRSGRLPWVFLAAAPACWALSEWLRSFILSGFPWAATAYAHVDGALSGFAPLVGAVGINYLASLLSTFLTLYFVCRTNRVLRFTAVTVFLGLIGGGLLLQHAEWAEPDKEVSFRLVQGGVAQDEKFSPMGTEKSFERYLDLMRTEGLQKNDVIVLPETVFPVPLERLPKNIWNRFVEITKGGNTLLFGGFTAAGDFYANSVAAVRDGRITETYNKKHLVPFGEYVPFGFRWFIDLLGIPMGDLAAGKADQPFFHIEGVKAALLLCYEDLFAEDIREWWRGSTGPNVFINLSNLGWFGNSLALPQHLNISRLRAKEFARPVVRATNTGATAYIDAKGTVRSLLPFMVPGVLDVRVMTMKGEPTVFARLGERPFVIFYMIILMASIVPSFRRKSGTNRLQ